MRARQAVAHNNPRWRWAKSCPSGPPSVRKGAGKPYPTNSPNPVTMLTTVALAVNRQQRKKGTIGTIDAARGAAAPYANTWQDLPAGRTAIAPARRSAPCFTAQPDHPLAAPEEPTVRQLRSGTEWNPSNRRRIKQRESCLVASAQFTRVRDPRQTVAACLSFADAEVNR